MLRSILIVAGLALAGCAGGAPPLASTPALPKLDAEQQRGHEIAVRRCGGCHTVGLDDGGAQEGPAFYRLARRYNAISLERRFAEVSAHGFDRMPPVSFTRDEAAALIAYFETLQGN
ncbi:MAG: cytochrome c [Phenylobacterium sp.]|uniref:c-type cytochrome n=1 Tax=Phenylobacterium sp. TaxID=1871053 RepID=UPI001A3BC392|nr:c-type cytochrome [Phenylobacterium sp.]MBL8770904.1 cytochrome c [Phenylobacterium sp.]